ncbi:MAG: response regulator transcription factor [Christensenellaceae bacterium]|jgi:DNA-binding response OmpR family regulator
MKLLIVEDETALADAICEMAKRNGYLADVSYDGCEGYEYALSGTYDAIILDIMLPGMDGLQLLQSARQKGVSTPVLLLTAKSETTDKIQGLDCGADDYLTKPFNTDELFARIRALTRRTGDIVSSHLEFGDITLSEQTHQLQCGEKSIRLGGKEYEIMEMLLRNHKQIIPKERFVEKIWGYESETEYNKIEVYISFLRKKLSSLHANVKIKAVRGTGYLLELSS